MRSEVMMDKYIKTEACKETVKINWGMRPLKASMLNSKIGMAQASRN